MKPFTLSQAREGVHPAVRMVSVRTALPFAIISEDAIIYGGIAFILISILLLIRHQFHSYRSFQKSITEELGAERTLLEAQLAMRTKEYLRAKSEHLAELERSVYFGELSKGLVHDLMNPLTAISLYVDKLKQSEQEKEIVHKVVTITKRMNSFMDSVRHSLRSTDIKKESIALLSEELRIVADILGYRAKTAEVVLDIKNFPDVTVPIHPVRFHQLLSNIISNAIDACIEDKTAHNTFKEHKVTVENAVQDSILIMKISDNGLGMSKDKLRDLFDRPETTKQKGTGIGLVTVKRILGEAGGTITVESTEGQGSTFTLVIPLS